MLMGQHQPITLTSSHMGSMFPSTSRKLEIATSTSLPGATFCSVWARGDELRFELLLAPEMLTVLLLVAVRLLILREPEEEVELPACQAT